MSGRFAAAASAACRGTGEQGGCRDGPEVHPRQTNVTMHEPVAEDWERARAIVAPPDDLEYGAAAAIAKWTAQGKTVVEVLATRGEAGIQSMPPEEVGPLRAAEQIEAARVVGVETVEFLDLAD